MTFSEEKRMLLEAIAEIERQIEELDAPHMVGTRGSALPMQPVVIDADGVARFRRNGIVRLLLDIGPLDMNKIAMLPGISREEHAQFAQLIGYSVSGYGELSYALNTDEAAAAAETLWRKP